MCGLTGLVLHDPSARVDEAKLVAMTDTMFHRGPDDRGIFISGPAGLGFRRLSIIDLSGGSQPLHNETDDVHVVMNGEIYNFQSLRADLMGKGHRFKTGSDAEVLVHLYEEKGAAMVEDLVGMYAFCVVDQREDKTKIVLGRDRLGIKPLYYVETTRGIAFASEVKALAELGWTARALRGPALVDYLTQGYVGGDDAAWVGIKRLPPSGVLRWEAGGAARVERTWDLPIESLREEASHEEVLALLDQVVSDRLLADVPLGAFLSGGIDSTAVVTSMKSALGEPPLVCSVGFRERSHDELETATDTAKRLGADQRTEILDPDPSLVTDTLPWLYDEPIADPSTLPTYLVSKMAREHVTVALSGDGGDEIFAGYRRYVHDVAENRLRASIGAPGRALARAAGSVWPHMPWAPRFLRGRTFLTNVGDDPAHAYFRSVSRFGREEAGRLLNPDLRAELADYDPFHRFKEHYDRPEKGVGSLYRAQYADFHTWLAEQILVKVDRASMGASLEVRVPILDHRFVGAFANLPAEQKISGGRGKHIFRESLRDRVSSRVLDGAKRGFDTPLTSWVKGPLKQSVAEAIETLPADWFDRGELRRVAAEHESNKRDHGVLLWSLLVLEHWRRRHAINGLAA